MQCGSLQVYSCEDVQTLVAWQALLLWAMPPPLAAPLVHARALGRRVEAASQPVAQRRLAGRRREALGREGGVRQRDADVAARGRRERVRLHMLHHGREAAEVVLDVLDVVVRRVGPAVDPKERRPELSAARRPQALRRAVAATALAFDVAALASSAATLASPAAAVKVLVVLALAGVPSAAYGSRGACLSLRPLPQPASAPFPAFATAAIAAALVAALAAAIAFAGHRDSCTAGEQ